MDEHQSPYLIRKKKTPTFIQSGMYLRFIPITKEEYVSLEGAKEWM
ncbi:hypothetical protein ACT7C5_27890 [Bacillus pacificus]